MIKETNETIDEDTFCYQTEQLLRSKNMATPLKNKNFGSVTLMHKKCR